MNTLNEIDRVFQLEINTLVKTRSTLDENYTKATDMLFNCKGKVVITGAGKSGLVAQKIASTMISTGTPAVFMSSSDGTHGDVGIVQKGDVLIAISKSGESEELLSLLPYIKEIGAPVISITAEPKSALANNSNLVLHTPVDEEACPLNLAPTSSTTVALVVGDGLAMALMKKRGFTDENFARFHPGGQLGKRLLLNVEDIMRSGEENPVVNVDHSVQQMLFEITSKRSGAVSISNAKGHLIGLVTDSDIRQILEQEKDIFSMKIPDIMNPNPTHIRSDAKAIEALALMENRERPFVVLPVVENVTNKLVGMIHLHDLVAKGL